MLNYSPSYSGGLALKFQPGDRLHSDWGFDSFVAVPQGKCWYSRKSQHDHFLPYPKIIHHSKLQKLNVQCHQFFFVMQSQITEKHTYLKTWAFHTIAHVVTGLFLPSSESYFIPSFLNATVLQYNVFLWRPYKIKPAIGLCEEYTAVTLYFHWQALERRAAQEILIGYAGVHNKEFGGIEHSLQTASLNEYIPIDKSQMFGTDTVHLSCKTASNTVLSEMKSVHL
jgi:hypothetical protein